MPLTGTYSSNLSCKCPLKDVGASSSGTKRANSTFVKILVLNYDN